MLQAWKVNVFRNSSVLIWKALSFFKVAIMTELWYMPCRLRLESHMHSNISWNKQSCACKYFRNLQLYSHLNCMQQVWKFMVVNTGDCGEIVMPAVYDLCSRRVCPKICFCTCSLFHSYPMTLLQVSDSSPASVPLHATSLNNLCFWDFCVLSLNNQCFTKFVMHAM